MTLGWTDQALRRVGIAVYLAVVGLEVATIALAPGIEGSPGLAHGGFELAPGYFLVMTALATTSLLLVWARPRNAVGWWLSLAALTGALCEWGQVYGAHALVVEGSQLPFGALVLSWSAPLWVPTVVLPATAVLARYPTGELTGPWARRIDRIVLGALVVLWVGYAGSAQSVTDEVSDATQPVLLPTALTGLMLAATVIVLLVCGLAVAGMTVRRMLRATWPERPQLAMLMTASTLSLLLVFYSPWEAVGQAAFSLLPIAVGIGVLRYRLLGIEVVVRRTLLYGALTGLVLAVFVAVTSALAGFAPDGAGPQLVAATVVAVGVVPARDRLQRVVDRLIYGDRRDPWRALDRLGHGAVSGDGLQDVLTAVTESLRLPAAELITPAGPAATVGVLGESVSVVPLTVSGQQVGELRVSPRSGERALGAEDQRLLLALAPLLAVVLRSTQLAEELRVEQERTVAATETERARLRRDLHDGLGPSLTGVGLGLEAIDNAALPERSAAVVQRLRAEVSSSLEEVRRIIDDLRPGALEGKDLVGLLTARAEQLSATTPVRVTVAAPDDLPPLPPAVEAAALRIVEEALTNVLRHASATDCRVELAAGESLTVRVADNGSGFEGPRQGGVGIGSMRARAAGLGGELRIEPAQPGTVVTAELPLAVLV